MRSTFLLRRGARTAASAVVLCLLAAACGDSGGDSASGTSAPTASGGSASVAATAPATTEKPVAGGTLTVATYQEPFGLDPVVSTGGGVTGAIEMGAIYDALTIWDPVKNVYLPRMAEAVTSNADFTEWTIKLRPGIKFTDGTDYDAEAVKWGIERHVSGLVPGIPPCEELRNCPTNTIATANFMGQHFKSATAVDKLTVKVFMTTPYATFAAALGGSVGMIPSPTALKAACPADKTVRASACSFNLKPVGAGPFIIESFVKAEAITVKKNPAYWNGAPYLDGIKFINLLDAGGDKTFEALKTGTAQAVFLRQVTSSKAAVDGKFPGFSNVLAGGDTILMNNGITVTCANGQPVVCAGKPDGPYTAPVSTARPKVRQAIAAAIDPVQWDARVNEGKGLPSTELLLKESKYYSGVAGPKYDLNKAKQLITEEKAAGWDGKIRFACSSTPAGQLRATTFQAMLQVAGATVETKLVPNVSVDVITNRDYETACWGLSPHFDDMGFWNLFGNLFGAAAGNRMGYKSAEMDAGLNAVRLGTSDEARKAGYKTIAEAYARDIPLLAVGALDERFVWSPKVSGIAFSVQTIVHFDKAWIKP